MYDFYTAYYDATETSRAHARFCEYAYGQDLCQHGFVTTADLDFLERKTGWDARHRVLDIGCGSGRITERFGDDTGAHMFGMDFVPGAIHQAHARTRAKRARLNFFVGDLAQLPCAPHLLDGLVSMDSLYFSSDYGDTLRQWASCLCPTGRMAIFFSHGVDPEHPKETFDTSTLFPETTPLGAALRANKLNYETWDFTASDYALQLRKQEALNELREQFAGEGNQFLYDNRMGEATGIRDAIESGLHVRYLYVVRLGQERE